ncbi:MAG TPA: hypothetical protein VKE69_08075, partial [Planctomycetota bacterium]|nr:hypothetical protein [Planctomycetota bacterium]
MTAPSARPLATAVALAIAASSGLAQQVFVVRSSGGPGVFSTEIQPAVDAASDGDIVFVQDGFYSSFTIDGKGLLVISDVFTKGPMNGTIRIQNLSSTQTVVVDRVFVNASPADATPALVLSNVAGPAWFRNSVFVGNDFSDAATGKPGAIVTNCASVTFEACGFDGAEGKGAPNASPGANGLSVTGSNVFLHDSSCSGGAGHSTQGAAAPTPGGIGLAASQSTVYASGTQLFGGIGGSATGLGIAGAAGGDALQTGGATELLDGALTPGAGGASSSGSHGAPGSRTTGAGPLTLLSGIARHFQIQSPVREQQPFDVFADGIPGENVGLLLSPSFDAGVFLAPFDGPILLSLASADALFLGTVPPSGRLFQVFFAGSLPPSMFGAT